MIIDQVNTNAHTNKYSISPWQLKTYNTKQTITYITQRKGQNRLKFKAGHKLKKKNNVTSNAT